MIFIDYHFKIAVYNKRTRSLLPRDMFCFAVSALIPPSGAFFFSVIILSGNCQKHALRQEFARNFDEKAALYKAARRYLNIREPLHLIQWLRWSFLEGSPLRAIQSSPKDSLPGSLQVRGSFTGRPAGWRKARSGTDIASPNQVGAAARLRKGPARLAPHLLF